MGDCRAEQLDLVSRRITNFDLGAERVIGINKSGVANVKMTVLNC